MVILPQSTSTMTDVPNKHDKNIPRGILSMKKLACIILIIGIVAAMIMPVSAANEIPLKVLVNGKNLYFPDAKPFIDENGRTQTPARFIGEELGATVTWDKTIAKSYDSVQAAVDDANRFLLNNYRIVDYYKLRCLFRQYLMKC